MATTTIPSVQTRDFFSQSDSEKAKELKDVLNDLITQINANIADLEGRVAAQEGGV